MKTIPIEQLQKIAVQYLNGLKRTGLETIPIGSGRNIFDFVEYDLEVPPIPADTSTISQHAASASVQEARMNYRQDLSAAEVVIEQSVSQVQTDKRAPLEIQTSIYDNPSVSGTLDDQRPYPNSIAVADRERELESLKSNLASCIKCSELARCRNKVVFGTGNAQARLVFLGEAPGADEDRQGEPFVGAAGQLLNKIIAACKMSRSDVYILNTIKCRPPGNRNPSAEELANCWEFTERQLEILRPEFICCLGLIATKQLLKMDQPLGRLRQRFHHYRESKVLVTYHPAYLLRTESAKKHVWDDMQLLMREMGIDLSK
jgi:DNA polymerase